MKNAVIVIAVCEVIRTVQITVDMVLAVHNRKNLNNTFAESLKKNNKEWAEDLLKEFLKSEKR